jgi:hypothetical protein
MRTTAIATAALLLVLPAASTAAAADGGAEVARLKAENERLRAELDHARKEIAELRQRLADVQAAMQQVKAEMERALAATVGPKPRPSRTLDIRVEAGGWGEAGTRDIQKVLASAAGELWKHFSDRRLAPIVVKHGSRGPIALYRREAGGEYTVKLDVEGTYWCQFAYQFAHEFCHILTNYSEKAPRENKWFDESLCEAASMYAVRQMSETWKTSPPYPNWRGYSSALAKYARNIRQKASDELPPGGTLAEWYRRNEAKLRKDPYQRDRNRLVAKHLLRLLEESPEHWEALGYLNLGDPEASKSFTGYLSAWHAHSPEKHRPFVRSIAERFGIKIRSSG